MNVSFLRECVEADFSTGKLTWRERPAHHFKSAAVQKSWNTRFAGKPALTARHSRGYACGAINNKAILAHRVIWALAHNEWPEAVDHINGNTADNRLVNLRGGTQSENLRNPNNKPWAASGYLGVHAHDGAWTARLWGKYLGRFKCPTAAFVARERALQHGG